MSRWTADEYQKYQKGKLGERLDKKLKYRNKPREYNGKKYASKKEAEYAMTLDMLLKAELIEGWEYEPKFIFHAYGKRITSYKIDFKVVHPDKVEYVEIKGGNATKTDAWRIRWNFLKAYLAKNEPLAILTLKD